jgi:O-methyltransferase involved in polyketide biosynthesis
LPEKGFDTGRPAVVASAGVSMYLTHEANLETLRQVAQFARGSTFAMTFLVPFDLVETGARAGVQQSAKGARASGTPFISFFEPAKLVALARDAGFREVRHVSASSLGERYFTGRTDGLRPPSTAEEILVATT